MERSIERDMDREWGESSGRDHPEGAQWDQPIDQRFYDRGPRYDQGGYRRGRGTGFDYEERYRPEGTFGSRGGQQRGEAGREEHGGHERPRDVYERRFEPGRYAGTNTYEGSYDVDPRGRPGAGFRGGDVYGGNASGNLMRGPHAGVGPKGYTRSDGRIRAEICERMAMHGGLNPSDIEVRVENGEVTLEGTVESRPAKRLAEDIAISVQAVHDVHNRLRLRDSRESTGRRERAGQETKANGNSRDTGGTS